MNRLRFLLALTLLPFAFACNDSSAPKTLEPEDYVGVYQLISINGRALPTTVPYSEDETVTVALGGVEFNEENEWTFHFSGTMTEDDSPVFEMTEGTFTVVGNVLKLAQEDETTTVNAVVSGSKVTVNLGGMLLVFTKSTST